MGHFFCPVNYCKPLPDAAVKEWYGQAWHSTRSICVSTVLTAVRWKRGFMHANSCHNESTWQSNYLFVFWGFVKVTLVFAVFSQEMKWFWTCAETWHSKTVLNRFLPLMDTELLGPFSSYSPLDQNIEVLVLPGYFYLVSQEAFQWMDQSGTEVHRQTVWLQFSAFILT